VIKGILKSYRGPWRGIDVSVPPVVLKGDATPYCNNVYLRGGYIKNRPPLVNNLATPDGGYVGLLNSFVDANNVPHTVVATQNNLYEIQLPYQLVLVSNLGSASNFVDPYGYAVLANSIYFSNLYNSQLWAWSGSGAVTTPASGSDGNFAKLGAAYMFELASSICLANTYEDYTGSGGPYSGFFPQRIRWCVAGNPTQWDIFQYKGAGFQDLLDTPDDILGVLPIGTVAYIIRRNGFTLMTPTGVGDQPFNFNHLWSGDGYASGTGNIFAHTIDSFGSIGCCVSDEDIFAITVSSIEPIGGIAKYAIYNDINTNSDYSNFPPIGYFLSRFNYRESLYLTYNIALVNGIVWTYSFDDKSWTKHTYPSTGFPCPPKGVIIG